MTTWSRTRRTASAATIATRVLLTAVLALVPLSGASGQASFAALPGTRVILLGKSNVNSWSCATSTFAITTHVDSTAAVDAHGTPARALIRLSVTVPVKSLDCGKARMNSDMFRALKADKFPEIRYVLTTYVLNEALAARDSFAVNSSGYLTVAGVTQRVEVQVNGTQRKNDALRGKGGTKFLMTDFGIKPPTAFFGAIRTKNAVEMRFEVVGQWITQVSTTRNPIAPF